LFKNKNLKTCVASATVILRDSLTIHFIPYRRSSKHYFSYRERIRVPASLGPTKGLRRVRDPKELSCHHSRGATMKQMIAMLMFTALGCHAGGAIARTAAPASDIPPTHIPHAITADIPPTHIPHAIAADIPPTHIPHAFAEDIPPTHIPHAIAVDIPPTHIPHAFAGDIPPTHIPHVVGRVF
jgi:hypothetical protein